MFMLTFDGSTSDQITYNIQPTKLSTVSTAMVDYSIPEEFLHQGWHSEWVDVKFPFEDRASFKSWLLAWRETYNALSKEIISLKKARTSGNKIDEEEIADDTLNYPLLQKWRHKIAAGNTQRELVKKSMEAQKLLYILHRAKLAANKYFTEFSQR